MIQEAMSQHGFAHEVMIIKQVEISAFELLSSLTGVFLS
jgi:hypothetical protein